MPALPATRDYQRAQVALRALTYKDITRLWVLLDPERLDETFPVFAAAVLQLIRQRREVSASFAQAYLTALRAGLPDPPVVDVPPVPVTAVLGALRFASVVSVKVAMTQRTPLQLASRNALVRTMGAADKFINDGGRELIRASVEADPFAKGWVRQTLGTCEFCAHEAAGDHMKAGDANFPRHDHCGCVPEPVYQGSAKVAEPVAPEQLNADLTEAERKAAFRYMWDFMPGNPSKMIYRELNGKLRKGKRLTGFLLEMQETMDGAIAKSVLTEDIAVNRVVGASANDFNFWSNMQAGETMIDQAFVSTTTDLSRIEGFFRNRNVVFDISVPAGRGNALVTGKGFGDIPDQLYQAEVILRRGSSFRVVQVGTGDDGLLHVVLEMLT